MLRNFSRLECVVNEKVGHFFCDINANLAEVKEMIFQFQKYIGQVEDNAKMLAEETRKKEEEEKQKIDLEKLPEVVD